MTVKTRIQIRRGNLADLPTLEAGEPGFTLDTHALYIGDGSTNWPISGSSGGGGGGAASGDMLKSTYDADIDGSVELADALLGASSAGSSKYYGTNAISAVGFYDLPTAGSSSSASNSYPCRGRLTLTSATPVTPADVTAATDVYFTPYFGDTIALYDGSKWGELTFNEQHIHLSLTLTPIVSTATKTLIDLEDTSQLTVGMEISGSGIAANSTIVSIDSASQVTMNNYGASNGHFNVTFKIPANKKVDIFAFENANALKLAFGELWYSGTARFASGSYAVLLPAQNGVPVKSTNGTSVDATRRYLGTIRTTATAGQTEDSGSKRFVWNCTNQVLRNVKTHNTTAYWAYGTHASREYNNGTGQVRGEFIVGIAGNIYLPAFSAYVSTGSASKYFDVALVYDAVDGTNKLCAMEIWGATQSPAQPVGRGICFAAGYHYITLVEDSFSADAGETNFGALTGYDLGGVVYAMM